MILIFSDQNESIIYKRPSRASLHREREYLLQLLFLKVFETNGASSFLFETETKQKFLERKEGFVF